MSKKTKGNLCLLLAAMIWGSAFVAQKVCTAGTYTFNGSRSFIAAIALLPVIKFRSFKTGDKTSVIDDLKNKDLLIGGILCGIVLFVAMSFQQMGISCGTDAGKAGFITAMYIILVPVCGIFVKKSPSAFVWISVPLAVIGLYLLCVTGNFTVSYSDFLVFICSIMFTVHIIVISFFSPKVDGVKLSCVQFFVVGIISILPSLIFDKPSMGIILENAYPIIYAGLLSSAVGYTLQIIGQKDTDPSVASLLMSMESVFAAISGWLILGERFMAKEFFGCVLMFVAIVISQLPEKEKNVHKKC